MTMKKSLLFTACGVLLAGLGGGCKESGKAQAPAMMKQPPPAVVTSSVELKANVEKRSYAGVVVSPAVVTLMPRISGELEKVGFAEGQIVKAEQVLYIFDDTRYKAAVANAEARVAECQAHLTFAESDYQRKSELRKNNAVSKAELENARSVRDAAISAKSAAEAQLITAKDDLANCVIKAPINGVIGVNKVAVGNYVTPSSGALSTINQITPIRVEFAMSNRDFLEMFGTEAQLKKDAVIKLKLADDSIFGEIGKVEFIDNNVNRRTDTIQVFATFPNARQQLRPGSSVSVMIERTLADNVPALPPSAIMPASDGKFYVYVVDNNKMAKRRAVKITTQRPDYVFISEGVKQGETVIIDGTHKVRIMPGKTEAAVEPVPQQKMGK